MTGAAVIPIGAAPRHCQQRPGGARDVAAGCLARGSGTGGAGRRQRALRGDEPVINITGISDDGRFAKGEHRSPATEFKPGQHWRPRKPHWDRTWLVVEYVEKSRSAAEIAVDASCTEPGILYWLRKHGIPRRTISESRAAKHWGASGPDNPMFGRFGSDNPNFVDGSSPERQRLYARAEGREFIKAIFARDGYRCVRCGAPKGKPKSLHAHHINPWAGNEALRFDTENGVTLCRPCHSWVHSKANVTREFLG